MLVAYQEWRAKRGSGLFCRRVNGLRCDFPNLYREDYNPLHKFPCMPIALREQKKPLGV